jgi:hypothetical protein
MSVNCTACSDGLVANQCRCNGNSKNKFSSASKGGLKPEFAIVYLLNNFVGVAYGQVMLFLCPFTQSCTALQVFIFVVNSLISCLPETTDVPELTELKIMDL